jgi:hypothetical protein
MAKVDIHKAPMTKHYLVYTLIKKKNLIFHQNSLTTTNIDNHITEYSVNQLVHNIL